MEDKRFLDAIAAFSPGSGPWAPERASVSPGDVCKVYGQVRPILERILPFLKGIPVIGRGIATALEALMAGLDAYCPKSGGGQGVESIGSPGGGDRAFLEALAGFDPSHRAAMPEAVNLCDTYRKVKPILEGILPFLSLIPQYGPAIAAGITALMTALNGLCPS